MSRKNAWDEGELVLLFHKDGTVELLDRDIESGDESRIWSSDADDDFREEFPDESLDPDDSEKVLEYLQDEDFLDSDELAAVVVESESDDETADDEEETADED